MTSPTGSQTSLQWRQPSHTYPERARAGARTAKRWQWVKMVMALFSQFFRRLEIFRNGNWRKKSVGHYKLAWKDVPSALLPFRIHLGTCPGSLGTGTWLTAHTATASTTCPETWLCPTHACLFMDDKSRGRRATGTSREGRDLLVTPCRSVEFEHVNSWRPLFYTETHS